MILNLDYTQRLNLVAILDTVECQGRREAHAICKLQDTIDLSDKEKESIGYRKDRAADGREYVMWANTNGLHAREFIFADADSKRITSALDNYKVILARDKTWWLPLVAQIPEEA